MADHKEGSIRPLIEDRGDRIILRGELGEAVVYDVTWSQTPGIDEFNELFDLDSEDYLGDPKDSFYQVIVFTRIISRKSDGKKFGISYCASPGNDSMESEVGQDLDALGVEVQYDSHYDIVGGIPYVFDPVEAFQRTGYVVQEKVSGD